MRLSDFYLSALQFGRKEDPRLNKKEILSYPDSAILFGKPEDEVRKILVGIDIEVPELLLADRVRESEGLDLVVGHHPEGKAYAFFYEVMRLQVEMLKKAGIELSAARQFLEEREREVERRVSAANHMRSVDAARILGLPFVCIHTPADNQVFGFLQRILNQARPKKVKDIVELLLTIPEYQKASQETGGPRVILGNPQRQAGKIFMEMTGGTEGPAEVYGRLYKSGIRTLVSMHLSEEHFKKVKDANLNVVIAGHISSDTLGLNLLLDKIEKQAKEKLTVIDCAGFRRFSRN